MNELSDKKSIYSLSDLAEGVRLAIYRSYPGQIWVKAEIAKLNIYPRSGHAYLDLVEKEASATKAQMRGIIWANDFDTIGKRFEAITHEPFKEGLKILFLARINFHEVYGFSLWISEIEPSFTLGELTRIKAQTIDRLKKEGVYTLNRQLSIPVAPLRVAIISAETSKGYLDFMQVIQQHPVQYRFEITLFPAFLQGDKAIDSIRGQLKQISGSRFKIQDSRSNEEEYETQNQNMASGFDLVAIIRGGGDEIGLTCFDNYDLAREICTFPLPVITGIGHSTNETVVEMVASLNLITPTEVAYDLLARLDNEYDKLQLSEDKISTLVLDVLSHEKRELSHSSEILVSIAHNFIRKQFSDLDHKGKTLRLLVSYLIDSRKAAISRMEGEVNHLDPKQILQRGYSMTYDRHGRILTNASDVTAGEKILTELASGTIESTVDP